ncbi:MAG: hypothetical protein H7124_04190 [Phycisphaerales bacterium]|nr:hypothetical protein [Hyphomonadaceae bacterium]
MLYEQHWLISAKPPLRERANSLDQRDQEFVLAPLIWTAKIGSRGPRSDFDLREKLLFLGHFQTLILEGPLRPAFEHFDLTEEFFDLHWEMIRVDTVWRSEDYLDDAKRDGNFPTFTATGNQRVDDMLAAMGKQIGDKD